LLLKYIYALYRSSAAGAMKAKVFPEPVFAAPKTSLPLSMCGIDLAWISVVFWKPKTSIAFLV